MDKIAAIQMCSSESIDDNLDTAGLFIKQAAEKGAKLIVLPEMFALISKNNELTNAAKEQFGAGKIQDFLAAQAKQHSVWLVGGTILIAAEHSHKARAASLVFNDQGHLVARYDKMHLFDVSVTDAEVYKESDSIEPGKEVVVVDTPMGKLGLGVCYDVRFPELFRILFNQGAEIIILPSAFTVKTGQAHWQLLTRSRAVENFCYLIGACQGGTHASGRKTYGHSLIVSPWGDLLAQLPNTQPGIIYATLDLPTLHQLRQAIPIAQHQKIFFDTSKLNF